jgi:hypothetical protein
MIINSRLTATGPKEKKEEVGNTCDRVSEERKARTTAENGQAREKEKRKKDRRP